MYAVVVSHVAQKLEAAGYGQQVQRGKDGKVTCVDMNGIALVPPPLTKAEKAISTFKKRLNKRRFCTECGALVKNINPKVTTCPMHAKKPLPLRFRHCPRCQSPILDNATCCEMCGLEDLNILT